MDDLRDGLMERTRHVIRKRFKDEFGDDASLSDAELDVDASELIDALLPTIRTHLAQAYAHGWRANAPHTPDEQIATRNPYEPANTRP